MFHVHLILQKLTFHVRLWCNKMLLIEKLLRYLQFYNYKYTCDSDTHSKIYASYSCLQHIINTFAVGYPKSRSSIEKKIRHN